jgi:hypothetical protein
MQIQYVCTKYSLHIIIIMTYLLDFLKIVCKCVCVKLYEIGKIP